jgi:phosphohistidine phosphatase SixA
MKRSILFIFVITTLYSCSYTTTIYLVRHAEKQIPNQNNMQSNDVELSDLGHERARVLRDSMQSKALKGVFATTVRRTQQTVEPTALTKGLTVIQYPATQPAADALMDSLVAVKGKKFLVAGHSNTVPAMVRHLGLPCSFTGYIPDNDYDNLFIITVRKGVKTVRETTYGAISP